MEIVLITLSLVGMYACKHTLADFFWQNSYMLGKFKKPPHCFLPLAAHCGVHVAILFVIMVGLGVCTGNMSEIVGVMGYVLAYEFVTHFIVDIIKAQYQRVVAPPVSDPRYWHAIGLDQLAHAILGLPVLFVLAAIMIGF